MNGTRKPKPFTHSNGSFLRGRPTLQRKTAYKSVVIATCKSKAKSIDLQTKLSGYFSGTDLEENVLSPYGLKEVDIQRGLTASSTTRLQVAIALPDLLRKLELGVRIMQEYLQYQRDMNQRCKFSLIIDEADAMFRTKDKEQKMEQSLERLCQLKPALVCMVTATPVPIMLLYEGELKQRFRLMSLGTSNDYSGVDAMKPLRDPISGMSVFLKRRLHHEDLSIKNIRLAKDAWYDKQIKLMEEESFETNGSNPVSAMDTESNCAPDDNGISDSDCTDSTKISCTLFRTRLPTLSRRFY